MNTENTWKHFVFISLTKGICTGIPASLALRYVTPVNHCSNTTWPGKALLLSPLHTLLCPAMTTPPKPTSMCVPYLKLPQAYSGSWASGEKPERHTHILHVGQRH